MKNIWVSFLKQTLPTKVTTLLLVAFFVSFALGQLGRISISPMMHVYPHDVLIAVWLLIHTRTLLSLLRQAFDWLRNHPLFIVTILWVVAGIAWGNVQEPTLRPFLIIARLLAYVLFAASVGKYFQPKPVLLRCILIVTGNIMLWFGLLQYVLLPDTRFLSILGWDDHYFRLIGPLFDPNFMGMLIILTSIYTFSVHWLLPKKAQLVLQSYYTALLALTYSRASYLAAAMAAFLLASTPYPLKYWRIRERFALGVMVVAAFSVTLLLAPKPGGEGVKLLRTSSITARQNTAAQTVQELSATDLILGKGLFTNPLNTAEISDQTIPQHAQVPDNILLLLLSGTGIIGTILLISSMVYWIGQLAMRETALAIALATVLVHAQFNNTFFEPFISLYLLLALLSPLDQVRVMAPTTKPFRAKPTKKITRTRKNYESR